MERGEETRQPAAEEKMEEENRSADENEKKEGSAKNFYKQKVALFFGYNGKAYRGLQKQK